MEQVVNLGCLDLSSLLVVKKVAVQDEQKNRLPGIGGGELGLKDRYLGYIVSIQQRLVFIDEVLNVLLLKQLELTRAKCRQ